MPLFYPTLPHSHPIPKRTKETNEILKKAGAPLFFVLQCRGFRRELLDSQPMEMSVTCCRAHLLESPMTSFDDFRPASKRTRKELGNVLPNCTLSPEPRKYYWLFWTLNYSYLKEILWWWLLFYVLVKHRTKQTSCNVGLPLPFLHCFRQQHP